MEQGFHAKTQAQIIIKHPTDDIELWFDNVPPEDVIQSTKEVAGIASTKQISQSQWGSPNSARLVCYKDHNSSIEQVIKNVPGKVFKYELWDFTNDFTHSIKYGLSEFEVIPVNDTKSILKWTFSFRPNNYIYRVPLSLYLKNSFQEYMQENLVNIKELLEQ